MTHDTRIFIATLTITTALLILIILRLNYKLEEARQQRARAYWNLQKITKAYERNEIFIHGLADFWKESFEWLRTNRRDSTIYIGTNVFRGTNIILGPGITITNLKQHERD